MFKIIRLPDVQLKTGLRRSAIYQKIADGEFPRQVKLSTRSCGWVESEVDAWISARIKRREGKDHDDISSTKWPNRQCKK